VSSTQKAVRRMNKSTFYPRKIANASTCGDERPSRLALARTVFS
jgi:hypothetical protein